MTSGIADLRKPTAGPPWSVKIAVIIFAVHYLYNFVSSAMQAPWRAPHSAITGSVWVVLFGLLVWILVSVWRGENWARWFLIVVQGLVIAVFHYKKIYAHAHYGWLTMTRTILQIAAIIFLSLPAAFRWFNSVPEMPPLPPKI